MKVAVCVCALWVLQWSRKSQAVIIRHWFSFPLCVYMWVTVFHFVLIVLIDGFYFCTANNYTVISLNGSSFCLSLCLRQGWSLRGKVGRSRVLWLLRPLRHTSATSANTTTSIASMCAILHNITCYQEYFTPRWILNQTIKMFSNFQL